ncbi:hypothetical protein QCA50_007308 [Cerrena zonata]|uniref:Uncharacterized protein n=1 Tax=Cerrena zonata TaxID=2478898 RepID=A0AAW0G9P0_9APHY
MKLYNQDLWLIGYLGAKPGHLSGAIVAALRVKFDNGTQCYTFSHPSSLLFATQFAQITLIATEYAAFEDMHSKSFVQKESAFACHSLREYSALISIANVLLICSLIDVLFYYSIIM